jgi:SAM-dependent methyltransferase
VSANDAWWLDARNPHEPEIDARQRDGLLDLLAPPPRRVLDIGCGAGRVLVPLAQAGHELVGIDRDPATLGACVRELGRGGAHAGLVEGDFTHAGSLPRGPFDAILCLGNTWMTVSDVDVAVALLARLREQLAPDGCIVLDDLPRDFWPELTSGHWLTGISEDGEQQLAWADGDAVFAWRRGGEVDPAVDLPRAGEPLYRLWTDGALRLAARAAGLSGPALAGNAHLLVMRRAVAGDDGPGP